MLSLEQYSPGTMFAAIPNPLFSHYLLVLMSDSVREILHDDTTEASKASERAVRGHDETTYTPRLKAFRPRRI